MKKNVPTAFAVFMVLFLAVSVVRVFALSDGYILVGAYGGTTTILMDKNGATVHTWNHAQLTNRLNGYSCYLRANGNLLRSAQGTYKGSSGFPPQNFQPAQGAIDEVDSSGKLVWTYTLYNDSSMLHHDMKELPSGNILATSYCLIPKTRAQSLGVDPALFTPGVNTLLGEKLIEIKPILPSGGEIVWQWCIFDHIAKKEEAAGHPELISGYIIPALWQGQWVHLNGLDYCAQTDLIVFSSRIFSELYVLDHGTTTALAAGHTGGNRGKGGDILYRWGNPAHYGATGGITLDCLHSTTWIPEGYTNARNILFFHNNMTAIKSQVIEIKPSLDGNGNFTYESGKPFGPAQPTWQYAPASSFYSKAMSTAIRMPNGNTVIHEAFPTDTWWEDGSRPQTDSRVREVTPEGQILWMDTLKMKGTSGFNPAKVMYYPSTHAGVRKLLGLPPVQNRNDARINGPALAKPLIRQTAGSIVFNGVDGSTIKLATLDGKTLLSTQSKGSTASLRTASIPAGLYCTHVVKGNRCVFSRMISMVR